MSDMAMSLSAKLRWRYENDLRSRWRRPAAALIRSFAPLPSVSLDAIAPAVQIVPPIMDDICMPPHHGRLHDDYGALMRIAASVQPRLILELGTAHGNTVANLCRQFPQTSVITVNALFDQQSGETTTFTLGPHEIGRVYREHRFEHRVVQLFQNTLDLDLSSQPEPVLADLAIVDACHDANFVENDFLKVAPHVRAGGIVLLHDTHPSMSEHLWGSYLACVRLRRRGYDICHVENTWWGIWRRS